MLIPRTFHQIWLGSDPFPDDYARYQRSWVDRHPGWDLQLWTEDNMPAELRRPEAAELLRAPAERADVLRLEVLWRFGGVYVDADFECVRSIEPLIEDAEFFIGYQKPGRVNNALFGSVAGHPILDRALDEIRPRQTFGVVDKDGTGPRFWDRLLAGEENVRFLEPRLLYPRRPEEQAEAYGIHHMDRSWKDAGLLREDMQRAEREMHAAREEARKWRARCKAAEAELGRLQRAWPYRLSRLGRRLLREGR